MTGGVHRLYGFHEGKLIPKKIYRPIAGLLVASLQSNRAFHDVDPIVSIDGERRAFYIAISCSGPMGKETNKDLSALSKNRYDPPPIGNQRKWRRRLLTKWIGFRKGKS